MNPDLVRASNNNKYYVLEYFYLNKVYLNKVVFL